MKKVLGLVIGLISVSTFANEIVLTGGKSVELNGIKVSCQAAIPDDSVSFDKTCYIEGRFKNVYVGCSQVYDGVFTSISKLNRKAAELKESGACHTIRSIEISKYRELKAELCN
jgi:hypothetical protein